MTLFTKQKQTHMEHKAVVTKGKTGEGINQEFGTNIHTTICKTDKQQGPTVQHRELYLMSYNNQ